MSRDDKFRQPGKEHKNAPHAVFRSMLMEIRIHGFPRVDGDQVLGRLAIRYRLTPALESVGGHIGYAVRPSARRQGHATAMPAAALALADSLGIAQVLITCDETNAASRRVIEANGGRYIDSIGAKRVTRYRPHDAPRHPSEAWRRS
jgi:predicted acetyltransferase